jgi:glycosyltransferase involved in cell wall biosynthesis
LRILQVVTDTDRRGAQVFAADLADELSRLGHSVRTVALERGSVPVLDLPVLGATRLGWSTVRALRREARAVDIVVAHGSTTLFACAIATPGVPFVYRQISDSRFWAPPGLRRARVRAGLRRAARVVALWKGSAATLQSDFGVRPERIRVIPNAVRVDDHHPVDRAAREAQRVAFGLDPARPTVVSVGALVPEKGVDLAISAVAQLDDAQLLISGDGPERGALEAQARRVAEGRVVFTSTITRAVDAYVAADVVVLASRGGDSMPAVLIEAGLMALPAVATPIEAIPEIVVAGATGVLVPVDDPVALADALRALIDDDDQRARLGASARAHCIEHFSIERVASMWVAALQDLV